MCPRASRLAGNQEVGAPGSTAPPGAVCLLKPEKDRVGEQETKKRRWLSGQFKREPWARLGQTKLLTNGEQ